MSSHQRAPEGHDHYLFGQAKKLARRIESNQGSQGEYQRALRAKFRESFDANPIKFREDLKVYQKLVVNFPSWIILGDLQPASINLRNNSEKSHKAFPENQMLRVWAFVALCYSLMLAACTDEVPPQIPTPTTTEVPPAAPTAEELTELVDELLKPTQTVPISPEPTPTSTLTPEPAATPKVAFATQTPAPEPMSEADATPAPQETGVGGKFSQLEQTLLTEIINQYATEWGIDASSENITVDKDENGIVYFLITNLEGVTSRIIYLASLDPITVAETDLAAARTAATANDTNPEAIVYLGLDLLTGQPGAFGANDDLILSFNPSSSMWQLPITTTSESTETPAPAETPLTGKMVALEDFEVYDGPNEKIFDQIWKEYPSDYLAARSLGNKLPAGLEILQKEIIASMPDQGGRGTWYLVEISPAKSTNIYPNVGWVMGWLFDSFQINLDKIHVLREAPSTPDIPTAVVKQGANLRGGPGTEYDIVGGLKAGDAVRITGRTSNGQWLQIELNDQTAWISASLINATGMDRVAVVSTPPPPPPPVRAPVQPSPTEIQRVTRDYIVPSLPDIETSIDLTNPNRGQKYNSIYGWIIQSISVTRHPNNPESYQHVITRRWHIASVVKVDGYNVTLKFFADGHEQTYQVGPNIESNVHVLRWPNNIPLTQFTDITTIYPPDVIKKDDIVGVSEEMLAQFQLQAILLMGE